MELWVTITNGRERHTIITAAQNPPGARGLARVLQQTITAPVRIRGCTRRRDQHRTAAFDQQKPEQVRRQSVRAG